MLVRSQLNVQAVYRQIYASLSDGLVFARLLLARCGLRLGADAPRERGCVDPVHGNLSRGSVIHG